MKNIAEQENLNTQRTIQKSFSQFTASGRGHLNVVLDNCMNRQSAKLSLRGKFTKFPAAMLTRDVILKIRKMLNPGLRDYSSSSWVPNTKYR